ncbi:hypothetical protein [Duganella violaceipulchra]|uniref:Lipoprotein n=1 Tax=Duganella violaceipulchra TaxID=2849652 RepID=A0AA41L5Q3_9BURK|nr:hypothetical protein [Duganella violaceicalia]MBV6322482.1 hypothetical protein [Duganella violaceicalia]MCP2010689.1 hypothetical protein [Duganella violaceicalia]
MQNAVRVAAILPVCAVLLGCGAGGDDNKAVGYAGPDEIAQTMRQTAPQSGPQRLADGVWLGTDADGRPAFALVSGQNAVKDEDRQLFYLAVGTGTGNYVPTHTGFATSKNGDIWADHIMAFTDLVHLGVRGHVSISSKLNSEIYFHDTSATMTKYILSYSNENYRISGFDKLQGNYSNAAQTPHGRPACRRCGTQFVKIDQHGSLAGRIAGCSLNGTLSVIDRGRNLYRLNLNVKSDSAASSCLVGSRTTDEVHLTGLAALAPLQDGPAPRLVFSTATSLPGGAMAMVAGAIPKQ